MKATLKADVWLTNPGERKPHLHASTFMNREGPEGWVFIGEVEQEFDLPTKAELAPAYIAACKKRIEAISLQAAEDTAYVEGMIRNFLAIEDDTNA